MKSIRTLVIAALAPIYIAGAEIPEGARVLLRLENSVSTRTAKDGDSVYLRTATPIAANSRVVVPIGSYVLGVIKRADRSGRVHGRAGLSIALETLMLPDGATANLSARVVSVESGGSEQRVGNKRSTVEQGPNHLGDAARIGTRAYGGLWGGLAMGAAMGALSGNAVAGARIGAGGGVAVSLAGAILGRSREVELRPGMTLDVVFENRVTIQ